jgi:protease-4
MNFFKSFLASCLGSLVAMVALVFLCIFMVSALSTGLSDGAIVPLTEDGILHLKLEAPISEIEFENPLAEYLPGVDEPSLGLIQIKQCIDHAKNDPHIKGIYLNTSFFMTGVAGLQEIREAIDDFKSSGKWVISYADFYTEGAYYVASVSDKVYMYNEGEVEFNGLATEVNFFKRLFDKLLIHPEIFRVGDFKSAVEPFMREDLSEENKLQLNSLLGSIYGQILRDISNSRKIPYEKLKEMSDKMVVRNPTLAVTNGLIDSLFYEDQVLDILRSKMGIDDKKKNLPFVGYKKYKKSFSPNGSSKNEIAVIVADGDILPGKAKQGVVGSKTIVEEVRKARNNDNVKAIVLRINSPGGAFQAADMMWREIRLAAKQKPVIASMGNYAASGGYYLAMACDTIVARPTTITGSIGVFSVLFDLSKFLGDKIGVTSEEVKTGEIGDLVTVTRPLTAVEMDIWQKQTEAVYETFTRKAAEGRSMTQDEIKKIASGRVWTGTQAKDNGLADVLGGLDDAIKIAAQKGNVASDYKLRYYPRPKPFLENLMGDWEENAKESAMKEELGEYYPWYLQWEKVENYQGVQLRMPVEFAVK